MIGFILKHGKLFLDIVLVVGLILAFTFWDPFHIFTKTQLKATANIVSGVRNIGQLVTAEYYGEVISSWKEFKLNEFPEDTITFYAEDLFIELKYLLYKVSNKRKIDDEIRNFKQREKIDIRLYNKFIAFLSIRFFNTRLERVYDTKNEKLLGNYEERVLKQLFARGESEKEKLGKKYKNEEDRADELQNYLDSVPDYISEFYPFYSFLVRKIEQTGPEKRKNIVFIGRGWIKAGFDFGTLDENNFLYDRDHKIIHFYGIKPQVLDMDINPWFIPQRKIKGFELVDYSGKVSFEDAKAVKKQCKEKLLEQALKADIITRALENGEEALKNFFSLVLDEPNIQVQFHTNRYDMHYAILMADSLISLNEALFVDSVYKSELQRIGRIESQALQQKNLELLGRYINDLKKLNFIDEDHGFNYYSMTAAAILKDSFDLSGDDSDCLLKVRGRLYIDTVDNGQLTTQTVDENPVWFTTGDFQQEFNATIDLLKKEALRFEGQESKTISDTKFKQADSTLIYNGRRIVIWDTLVSAADTTLRFYYLTDIEQRPWFPDDLLYNPAFGEVCRENQIIDTAAISKKFMTMNTKTVYNHQLASLNIEESDVLLAVLKNNCIYHKQVDPLKKFLARADRLINRLQTK